MPDRWTFTEPPCARPWARCWGHHQILSSSSKSPQPRHGGHYIKDRLEGVGEPRDGAPCSDSRIGNDFQEGTPSRLGPGSLMTIQQVQRKRMRFPLRGWHVQGFTSTSGIVNAWWLHVQQLGARRMLRSKRSVGTRSWGALGINAEDSSFLLESRVLGWSVLRSDLGLRR